MASFAIQTAMVYADDTAAVRFEVLSEDALEGRRGSKGGKRREIELEPITADHGSGGSEDMQ